ncbi:hypothetical protein P1I11_005128, partial [Escherichia coli]
FCIKFVLLFLYFLFLRHCVLGASRGHSETDIVQKVQQLQCVTCREAIRFLLRYSNQKNSARRRPVTGRSPRTGEEAQCICSYSEQVRPEALS